MDDTERQEAILRFRRIGGLFDNVAFWVEQSDTYTQQEADACMEAAYDCVRQAIQAMVCHAPWKASDRIMHKGFMRATDHHRCT